jgi:hypothetical protein
LSSTPGSAQFPLPSIALPGKTAQMFTIILVGAVAAAAMFVILLKLSPSEHKKAEKMEKGDIIKQLLALSELESRTAKAKTALPPAKAQPANAARPAAKSPEIKPAEKTSECLGC